MPDPEPNPHPEPADSDSDPDPCPFEQQLHNAFQIIENYDSKWNGKSNPDQNVIETRPSQNIVTDIVNLLYKICTISLHVVEWDTKVNVNQLTIFNIKKVKKK